uniref:Uncharacterized protein n=1 Tax=Sus scrofa TaxID=9823 RepID=A0A4X1V7J4_PIG
SKSTGYLFLCIIFNLLHILYFLAFRYFTSIKFIPKYFILFYAILNFLKLSLSDSSLVYSKATDVYILILYPATLRNLFTSSNSFFVKTSWFSIFSIMSSANCDTFTSSLPIWMPFISFSFLNAMTTISNTMLNRSGKNRHHCLVPKFREKISSSFSPLSMMLGVGFVINGLYYMEI